MADQPHRVDRSAVPDSGAVPGLREAIIVMRVPLREGYPWKPSQRPAEEILEEGVTDGIRWLDCVDGRIRVEVCVNPVGIYQIKAWKP